MSASNPLPNHDVHIPWPFEEMRSDSTTPTPSSKKSHSPRGLSLLTAGWSLPDLILRPSSVEDENKDRPASIVTNPYERSENSMSEDFSVRVENRNRFKRHSKWSPTPSMKRGKAERLLKEHGSPPGIRVTAGGRIVPEGLQQLSSSLFNQYPQTKYMANYNRFPRVPGQPLIKAPHGNVFPWGSDLYQVVHDELKLVPLIDGRPQFYLPPTNYTTPGAMQLLGQFAAQPIFPSTEMGNGYGQSYSIVSDQRQLRVKEDHHNRLEAQLKELDRYSVLYRDEISFEMKTDIVKQRMCLIEQIDQSRRSLVDLKKVVAEGGRLGYSQHHQAAQILPPDSFYSTYPPHVGYGYNDFEVFGQSFLDNSTAQMGISQISPQAMMEGALHDSNHFSVVRDELVDASKPLQGRTPNADAIIRKKVSASSEDNKLNGKKSIASNSEKDARDNALFKTHARRSHAIQIKKPEEASSAKSALNPASPIYEPADNVPDADRQQPTQALANASDFIPSPILVAEMNHLTASPTGQEAELRNVSHDHHDSSSSATTGDFFPNDTEHYSVQRHLYMPRKASTNVSAWAPNQKKPEQSLRDVTPVRGANALWEDSPHSKINVRLPTGRGYAYSENSRNASNDAAPPPTPDLNNRECDLDFIAQGSFRQISPTAAKQQSTLIRNATSSTDVQSEREHAMSSLESKLEKQLRLGCGPVNSVDYEEGFSTGYRQDIMAADKNENYRTGYRDGFLASALNLVRDRRATNEMLVENKRITPPPVQQGRWTSENQASRTASNNELVIASFQPHVPSPTSMMDRTTDTSSTAYTSPMPSTHRTWWQIREGDPSKALQPDSSIGKQALRPSLPPSPLSDRYVMNRTRDGQAGKGLSFAERMSLQSGTGMDDQRYTKTHSSIAQTNTVVHAKPYLAQFDGSGEDVVAADIPANLGPLSSPLRRTGGSGSPVKAKASAAMAKIEHLTGVSRRERSSMDEMTDTRKMGSPEKEKWLTKLRKRFNEQKDNEQRDTDSSKKDDSVV